MNENGNLYRLLCEYCQKDGMSNFMDHRSTDVDGTGKTYHKWVCPHCHRTLKEYDSVAIHAPGQDDDLAWMGKAAFASGGAPSETTERYDDIPLDETEQQFLDRVGHNHSVARPNWHLDERRLLTIVDRQRAEIAALRAQVEALTAENATMTNQMEAALLILDGQNIDDIVYWSGLQREQAAQLFDTFYGTPGRHTQPPAPTSDSIAAMQTMAQLPNVAPLPERKPEPSAKASSAVPKLSKAQMEFLIAIRDGVKVNRRITHGIVKGYEDWRYQAQVGGHRPGSRVNEKMVKILFEYRYLVTEEYKGVLDRWERLQLTDAGRAALASATKGT